MRVKLAVLCCVVALLTGCKPSRSGSSGDVPEKTFAMRGKIVSVNPGSGEITVEHQAIPGYMEAMTMPYRLVDANTVSEMHPGDVITARVVVRYDAAGPLSPRLDHVVIVAQARPDNKPAVIYHVPQPGDAVPDFQLLNQSGQHIRISQFKGKVLLVSSSTIYMKEVCNQWLTTESVLSL